jgi:predicted nucleic acid-binding protein
MTPYYLDASALSKRYVQEIGTAWVSALVSPTQGHVLLTARITMVEVYSALARRKREGTVPATDCDVAAQAFASHCASEYDFVELSPDVIDVARDLLDRHALRAYDAVQLASALIANRALVAAQLKPLVFLSADDKLNGTAASEGLDVENPNAHP